MGSVFSALDVALERTVAVKFLGCAEGATQPRFIAEARALARLDHPNIVPVFAYGEHGGLPFLVMKRAEGRTLEQLLLEREGRLAPAELLPLVAQLGAGLDAMHAEGLVHRDLKPANVMVSDTGRLTIIDLGIARDHRYRSGTRTGMAIGTPRYMSPEQVRGDRDVGHATDLYALGVVTFEALTGTVLFPGSNPVQVMQAHLTEAPVGPSEVRGELPVAVDAVLARALAKDPARRYGSASAFHQALVAAFAETDAPKTRVDVPCAAPRVVAVPVVRARPATGRGRLALVALAIAGVLGAACWQTWAPFAEAVLSQVTGEGVSVAP
jgi:serine/threonine-protein kinase